MGNGTSAAEEAAESKTGVHNMYAGLSVRAGGNTIWERSTHFELNGQHVEMKLLLAVENNIEAIKAAAGGNPMKITIYCPWSPCVQCVSTLEKIYTTYFSKLNSNSTLKFVFENYYTKTAHGSGATLSHWESEEAAEKAYKQLSARSGTVIATKSESTGATLDEALANVIILTKSRPRITIKKKGAASSSSEWVELGKF